MKHTWDIICCTLSNETYMGYFAVHSLCPNGFLKHDNSCYKMIRTLATWAEATVSMNSLDISFCSVVCLHCIASR